jgi:SAM-dependent methyltransferase
MILYNKMCDNHKATVNYSSITETPGLKATHEQIERLYHRYKFASDFVNCSDVLEVACGSGLGLGYLSKKARRVVGSDIDEENLTEARRIYQHYNHVGPEQGILEIIWMDAHDLNFPDHSFDLILLYEAIYYLREPQKFLSEAKRVLTKDGILIICTVNKDWVDFHPSPYAYQYFSVPELYSLLDNSFTKIELFGAFPVKSDSMIGGVISIIKRIAVHLELIPRSLAARAYLKRLFLGPLKPLPEQIYEGMARYEPPVPIQAEQSNKDYKIIYAVARINEH